MTSNIFSVRSLGQRLKEMKTNLFQSKSKLNIVFDIAIYLCFALTFFSIPACSFTSGLNFITWGLTGLLVIMMVLSGLIWQGFKINVVSLSFVFFGISALISSLLNGMVNFIFTPIFLAAMSFFIYEYVLCNEKSRKILLYMAYIGVVGFMFLYLYRYRSEIIHLNFERLGGIFGDENDIAIFMSFGSVLSFYFLFADKNIWMKLLFLIIFLLFALCGVTSGSKIFILILLVCCSLIIVLHFGLKRWYVSLILFALLGVGVFFIFTMPFMSTIRERILSFIASFSSEGQVDGVAGDYSTAERVDMFLCGMEMFLRKPLFGYGIWGFANFGSINNGWSHNHISETFCNFGLIGTFFFSFGFVRSFICYFKNLNKSRLLLPFILLIFFTCCMVSVALNSQKIYAYLIPIIISIFKEPNLCFKINLRKAGNNENS